MAGTSKENGSGSDAKEDDERKIVYRTKERKMMEGRLFIGRRRGRPHMRWVDDVVADWKVMKIKQWVEKTKDREQWRLVAEETKAHPGL
jgi:hypothetical protein